MTLGIDRHRPCWAHIYGRKGLAVGREGPALAMLLSEPRVHSGTLPPRDGDSRARSTRHSAALQQARCRRTQRKAASGSGQGLRRRQDFPLGSFILGFVIFIFRNPRAFFLEFIFNRFCTAQTGGFGALTGCSRRCPCPDPPPQAVPAARPRPRPLPAPARPRTWAQRPTPPH